MTPVLVEVCARRGLDPVPFLLALACAANVGSAATLIGNPQNMLIGEALDLPFARYLWDAGVPAAAGLVVTWAIVTARVAGRWAGRHEIRPLPAWPLWLMRWQVAIVYLSSGLYKFAYPMWRDGTAVHWAMNLNAFHRFPWPWPVAAAPLEAFLTWSTLLFELTFWLLVIFRRTRPLALIGGAALHAGLFATMELGPFSFLMVASYVCYIDPERTKNLFRSATN